ncbi:MAG: hypothetical protein C4531_04045 [Desulfurivibrio sp.]|jgi:hypothetical protein|nr:MAG: hypothetical protein C4531_04045 [Desulfurivibrio sp.]
MVKMIGSLALSAVLTLLAAYIFFVPPTALRMHGAQVLAAMDYTRDFFGLIKDAAAAPGPRE